MGKELQDELDALTAFAEGEDNPGASGEEEGHPDGDLDNFSDVDRDAGASAGEEHEEGADPSEGEDTPSEGQEASGEEGEEETTETEAQAKIRELEHKLLELQAKVSGTQEQEDQQQASLPELKPEIGEFDIMAGHTYDELLEDEQTFQKWAKNLVAKTQELTQEAIYKKIPALIQAYAEQTVDSRTQAMEFYQSNPDLAEYKTEVAKNATLIANAEPNLSREDFHKKVADYTRYQLKLEPAVAKKEEELAKKPGNRKPAFNKRSAKAQSRMVKEPDLAGIDKEIDEMIKQMDA